MSECPVCEWPNADIFADRGDWTRADCPRCGTFRISFEAGTNIKRSTDEVRSRVSGLIRNSKSADPPDVSSEFLDRAENQWHAPTVSEKLDALLRGIARSSKYPGHEVPLIDEVDYVLAWGQNAEEFKFFKQALYYRGLINQPATLDGGYSLTPEGWYRLDELRAGGESSNSVFVAMAFSQAMNPAWVDGLHPGIISAGYAPERADSHPHNDKIDDRIMAAIRGCRFLVVDVTTQNRGAYFEAGFGLGLGRPVIWTVQADDLDEVHFDTRQFNHIVWTTPADLQEKIEQRIVGVFGRGKVTPN